MTYPFSSGKSIIAEPMVWRSMLYVKHYENSSKVGCRPKKHIEITQWRKDSSRLLVKVVNTALHVLGTY